MNPGSQKEKVKDTFNDRANIYYSRYHEISNRAHSFQIRRRRVYELLSTLNCGKILDIGCGPGIMRDLIENSDYDYYGVDISEKMIKECIDKYKNVSSAKFSVGKIEKLKFAANSFDVAIAMGVFEYLDNDEAAIKEMKRVVKSTGQIIITLPNKLSPYRIWDRYIYIKLVNIIKLVIGIPINKEVNHNELSENDFCRKLNQNELHVQDIVYYNMNIFLSPLDKYFPRFCNYFTNRLECLYKSILKKLGTGFIIVCTKK